MKNARFWLLLLLAALLPIRSAIATAMLCPPAGVGPQTAGVSMNHHGHHGSMEAAGSHGHEHAETGHGAAHDGSALTTQDECNLCTAFCSVTPLVGPSPIAFMPHDPTSTAFPAFSAPAPSFLSDGQERPPRSL